MSWPPAVAPWSLVGRKKGAAQRGISQCPQRKTVREESKKKDGMGEYMRRKIKHETRRGRKVNEKKKRDKTDKQREGMR